MVIGFALLNAFSWICLIFKKQKDKTNEGFIEDTPYSEENEIEEFDLFHYATYAEKIADQIVKTYPQHSFTIGINGEWGSGKTSFMNMVAEKAIAIDPKITLLKFNAWESNNAKHIIPDFLEELKNKVGLENNYLAKKLNQYAEKLSPLDKSGWLKVFQSYTTKTNSISALKNQISQMLRQSGNRLLILIDDLDRLDKDELLEVYRLVRNSINFSNVIFMLAYDRGHLDNIISKVSSHNPNKFLEKITQVEFALPIVDRENLIDTFRQTVLQVIDQSHKNQWVKGLAKEQSTNFFQHSGWIINRKYNLIRDFYFTKRDITRLTNLIRVDYPGVLGEVVFQDYMMIKLLQLKYPIVHNLLLNRSNEFLDSSWIDDNQFEVYTPKYIDEPDNWAFIKVLKDLDFSEYDLNIIESIMKQLFPWGSERKKDSYHLTIFMKKNFEKYFTSELVGNVFSETSYQELLHGSWNNFKVQIKSWVDQGLSDDIKSRLQLENPSLWESKLTFKNTLQGILYLGTLKKPENNRPVEINHTQIQYWLLDMDHSISSKFYSSPDEFKQSVQNVLNENEADWNIFKSDIVNRMKTILGSEDFTETFWLFTRAELLGYNIQYLERAIEFMIPKRYNQIISILMYECIDKSTSRVAHEAISMVKEYCVRNQLLEDLYWSFIGRWLGAGASYETATYTLNSDWNMFYQSLEELASEMETSDFPHRDEYLGFVSRWNETPNNRNKKIDFPFSQEFMKDLDDFWKDFKHMPEMPLD